MSLKIADLAGLLDQMPVKRLKAENVLLELLEAGLCKKEDLVVLPERSPAYFFERDISTVKEIMNPVAGNLWFRADIPRDGFYDTLPERLFHRPIGRGKNGGEWDEIREEEVKQEAEARLFFAPFDSTVSHQLIQIARFEKDVLAGDDKRFLKEFLQVFWPEASALHLNDGQKIGLYHLTVSCYRVAGNLVQMQECFNRMVVDPVELCFEDIPFEEPVENEFAAIGEMVIGVDAMLAKDTFMKWTRLRIKVGPLTYEQMNKYFPGCAGERLLHFLCSLLVPVEMDWIIDLVPDVDAGGEKCAGGTLISFTMDDATQTPVLGFTTVL